MASPNAEPAAATSAVSDLAERMAAGKALYTQRKYVEAARVFESLDTAGAVYNAAMSRAAAGHDAQALLGWIRYLERAPEAERAAVQTSVEEARELTIAVEFVRTADNNGARTLVLRGEQQLAADELRLAWPDGQAALKVWLDPGRWSAQLEGVSDGPRSLVVTVAKDTAERRYDLAPPHPPVSVRLQLGPRSALRRGVIVTWVGPGQVGERRVTTAVNPPWALVPGQWKLVASAKDHDSVERAVEVVERPVDLSVRLKRDPQARARLGLGVGLGVTAVGLAAGGGALLAAAYRTLGGFATGALPPEDVAQVRALRRTHLAGLVLLSAGASTATVALTSGLTRGRKVLVAQAGLGAGFVLVGAVLLGLKSTNDDLSVLQSSNDGVIPRAGLEDGLRRALPGAVMIGVGLGLLVPAAMTLVTRYTLDRQARRRQVLDLSMDTHGIVLRGTF
jgi:hypothetical protein